MPAPRTSFFRRLLRDSHGATAIEYGLGSQVRGPFTNASSAMSSGAAAA